MAALSVPAGDAIAADPGLTPHHAVYNIRLGATRGGGAPESVSGTLVYELGDQCDGYTVTSQLTLDITEGVTGESRTMNQIFGGYESKDGRTSTFRMALRGDSRVLDFYRGSIDLDADGRGTMSYTRDETASYDLPEGTLFSTHHIAEVITAARDGTRFLSRVVADGLFDNGPQRVSAVISQAISQESAAQDPDGLLLPSVWPVNFAYFPYEGQTELPTQEMRVLLYGNGIIQAINQDMGTFSIVMTLAEVRELETVDCGG